jgi:hypothetical protein
MENINFTQEKFAEFLLEYLEAEMQQKESFDFEGHTFLTSYAKHLVQYLLPKFAPNWAELRK